MTAQTPARRPRCRWLAGGLLACALSGAAVAQYVLDANFQVGSGGYNRPSPTGAALLRQRYTVATTRSVYTVNGNGNLVYNKRAAFNRPSRYQPTGYASHYERAAFAQQPYRY